MKLFNHWLFENKVLEEIDNLREKKEKTTDPYEQWNIQSQIDILEKIIIVYKNTVEEQFKN